MWKRHKETTGLLPVGFLIFPAILPKFDPIKITHYYVIEEPHGGMKYVVTGMGYSFSHVEPGLV